MPEIEQREVDPRHDLVGYEKLANTPAPFQLWIGGSPVRTESAKSANVAFQKYELAALVAGVVVAFVAGTHNAFQAVIVAQPIATGGNRDVPYWDAGNFNHEAVIWPAGAAFDTYLERKAFFTGTKLTVGHLI